MSGAAPATKTTWGFRLDSKAINCPDGFDPKNAHRVWLIQMEFRLPVARDRPERVLERWAEWGIRFGIFGPAAKEAAERTSREVRLIFKSLARLEAVEEAPSVWPNAQPSVN